MRSFLISLFHSILSIFAFISIVFFFVAFKGICQPGGWCDGQTFHPCGPGTYNSRNGSKSAQECINCPPGYYCQNSGLSDYSSYQCPAGYYCPEATKYSREFPCPAGTYNPDLNATAQSPACRVCPATKYCVMGSKEPVICAPGYYCPEGTHAANQFACHAGTYNDQTGLKNFTECKTCPAGYYCPEGTTTEPPIRPIPCPEGTYNPYPSIGFVLNCIPCTAGKFCPSAGQTNATDICYEGYYCPNGTVAGHQFPCPPGTYGDRPGMTVAEECLTCPAGKSCGWGIGLNNNNTWQVCRQGHYCPAGTPSPTKFPCPPGTFTTSSDLYDASQCTVCTERSYCLGGEAQPSGNCPPGYYCPNGTKFAEQFPCKNGTYNPAYSKSKQGECLDCTQGHFCEKGSVHPEHCPIGRS